MTREDLIKKIEELRGQHTTAFSQLHQIEGALGALQFVLAQMPAVVEAVAPIVDAVEDVFKKD